MEGRVSTKLTATELRNIIREEVERLLEAGSSPAVAGGELAVGQLRTWRSGTMPAFKARVFKILGVPKWSVSAGMRHGMGSWSEDSQASGGDVNNSMKVTILPMVAKGGEWTPVGGPMGVDVARRDIVKFSVPVEE